MDSLIQITTTSDDREELERIASQLVELRLAACCQISGPITSWYTWNGQIESASEWTCVVKTVKHCYSDVEDLITRLHHYDEPQIIALEICLASQGYQNWVRQIVKQG